MFIFSLAKKTNRKPAQQKNHPESFRGCKLASAQTLVRQPGTIRPAFRCAAGRLPAMVDIERVAGF